MESASTLNDDNDVTFMTGNHEEARAESVVSPERGVRTITDESEEITRLRRDNFNLRLLCHNYRKIYEKGLSEDPVLRITDLESENLQLSEQLREKSNLLSCASKLLTSLKNENEQIRADRDEWIVKFESSEREWRQKYDKLAEELHSLRVSRREAESKCELVENESFRREAAQKAEVSCLQKQLSDAESKIASLEAEVDSISREKVVLQSAEKENSPLRVACESPGLLPLNVVSSRPSSPKTMSEPIKSPQKREYTGLVRRHNAARLITEELTNRNIGLTRELAVCKQALAASQAKLSLVTEQLEEEKASHTNDVQALHDRVADLLGDRDCEARRCDSLLTEVNQLKEYNERIKREHVCQLRTFDKILQDRERAIYELISMTNGGGDEPRGSVKAHWEGDGCVTKAPQMLHPIDETMPLGEATQISHDESSSVFNTSVENPANIQVVTQAGEVARLQNEVVNLRSRLMAQVKTNMRLKTAYKALASSSVKAPVNLSQSLNRTSNDAGVANASRVDLGSFTFGGGGLNDTNCGLAERSMTRGEPGEVLEKTVHELHTTLERLECEISALEQAPSVTRPCNLPNTVATSAPSQSMNEAVGVVEGGGDEKAKEMCVCSVAVSRRGSVQSLERLKELHSVIKSLLTQFDSIRTIQRSFRETANRSLMVSISSEVECGTQQTWSFACDGRNPTHNGSFGGGDVGCEGSGGVGERCTKWPAERDCDRSKDGDDVVTETDCVACQSVVVSQHAESLLLSTCNDTTMGNLRLDVGGDTEASRGDVDDSLDVSSVRTGCQSLVGGRLNVSRVEDHNRRVFDRVSVAVARIQDAVDKWSVKVAAEVLMALNGPDKFDYVVDDGDRRDYSQRREMHVSFSKVRDEHSEWADETEAGEVEEALEEEVKTISLREHEAIVAEYESRCSQLTSANDELQKTYVQLSEELESAYRKHAESIATLQATMVSKSDYDELVGEVTQAQNVARELENRANELQVCLTETTEKMASVSAELEASRADVLGLRRRLSESEGTVSRHLQDLAEVASRSRAFAERLAGAKNRAAVVAGEMSTGWRDCLEQEVMVMASVEVLESLLGDFKAAESRLGELEAQKKAEEEGRVERVTAVYEAKLVEQKAQLEGRLNERVMAYEKTMRDVEAKYAALLEAAESRHVAAAERCERLVAREAELVDEMEAKDVKILGLESDLVAVRMTAAETQVELESLNRRMVEREEAEGAEEGRNTRRSSASEMEEKARKYPELKAIAFDLKSRLRKRAELLESSMKENRRLRRIVHENERRAKGFLEELERLRRQIVEKKGAIKKLEAVARSLPVRHVGARPCDYDAPPETRKSPRRPRSVEWSCKDCGHEVAPDVLGRAEVDLGVGEEVAEGKEKEEGEECVGVAVGTAAEPGATLNTVVTSATQLHDVKASVPQEVRCVSGKLMSVPPCWKQQSMPGGVGGVSSLVTSIEVTIRELSKCLESQRQASVMAEDATYSLDADDGALTNTQDVNDTLSVTSDGGSLSVSASSLSRQSSYRCSERGVSSVAVGVAPRKKSLTPNPGAIGDLQEHISRCARELSSLCFALMQELTKPEAASGNVDAGSGVMVGAECGSSDHRRARAIISRTVKCVSALLEQKGGDEVLSCVVSDLREALRLLGPGRLNSPRQSHQGDSASNSCRSRSSGGATARKPTVTTSSSCSCQQRCSRVINTVEELTAMLNSTASVLSESAVQTRRQPHESGSP